MFSKILTLPYSTKFMVVRLTFSRFFVFLFLHVRLTASDWRDAVHVRFPEVSLSNIRKYGFTVVLTARRQQEALFFKKYRDAIKDSNGPCITERVGTTDFIFP